VYGADVHFDGMLYATIARPAVYGGKVKSLDDSAALKVPGVLKSCRSKAVRCLRNSSRWAAWR
jgi:isoquinoline 1-oxidoreductase beta subunit